MVVGFVYYIGFLITVVGWIALDYIFGKLVCLVYGLDELNSTDSNVFFDQKSNRCNIMGALILKKCEPETFRNVIVNKMPVQYKRFRSKMVKVLDRYYFKEIKGEELQS